MSGERRYDLSLLVCTTFVRSFVRRAEVSLVGVRALTLHSCADSVCHILLGKREEEMELVYSAFDER